MKIHSNALSLNNSSNSSSLKSEILDFNSSIASSFEYVKSSGRREINSFSNSKRSFSLAGISFLRRKSIISCINLNCPFHFNFIKSSGSGVFNVVMFIIVHLILIILYCENYYIKK